MFLVTFYRAALLTYCLEAEVLASSACLWCYPRWLTALCGNRVDWPQSSNSYDSPVLTPSTASEFPTWPKVPPFDRVFLHCHLRAQIRLSTILNSPIVINLYRAGLGSPEWSSPDYPNGIVNQYCTVRR